MRRSREVRSGVAVPAVGLGHDAPADQQGRLGRRHVLRGGEAGGERPDQLVGLVHPPGLHESVETDDHDAA